MLLNSAPAALLQPQNDWPQWRGLDGMAASSATNLPTQLGPDSPELLWRAAVPGEGVSSPIVQGGNVFLTTAYPGEMGGHIGALRFAIPVLALLALGLLLARRKRALDGSSTLTRAALRFDGLVLALGTLLFALGAYAVTFHHDRLWEPGSPGYRWFYTGAVALLGLALAFAWFRPASAARAAGVLVVLGAAWWLVQGIPANKYASPFRSSVRLMMIAPGLAVAVWHALALRLARAAPAARSPLVAVLGAGALACVAAATFAIANYLAPSSGLVRAALCFELASGKLLWNTPLFVAQEEKKYPKNSFATPTPCATREVVFAHFGAGYAALDHQGRVLWKTVDESYHERTRYGASSSPVLLGDAPAGDSVVYLHDREINLGPSYVTRIELATGKVLWHKESQRNCDSYTTPLLVEREGERQLLAVSFDRLYGLDPESGEELWSSEIPLEQMVPSLQMRGDLLLASGGSHLKFSTSGLRLTGKGKQTRPEVLWQSRRAVPPISSPVWIGDHFFTVTDGGIMTCYEPASGAVRWQDRLPGSYWASLVAGDGKVYALNEDGLLSTVRVGPELEIVAQGDFASPCYATPAIAGERVLVRTERELFCFVKRD